MPFNDDAHRAAGSEDEEDEEEEDLRVKQVLRAARKRSLQLCMKLRSCTSRIIPYDVISHLFHMYVSDTHRCRSVAPAAVNLIGAAVEHALVTLIEEASAFVRMEHRGRGGGKLCVRHLRAVKRAPNMGIQGTSDLSKQIDYTAF